ncbi:MAG: glycosyltransferase [Treponemataceae bacterium]|nr:glycosyltransferase [Treponemataceae bacterium]
MRSKFSVIIQGIKRRLRPVKYILLKIKYTLFCLFSRFNSVENCLHDSKSSILFITHSLGGGTYQFEKNFIKERVKEKIFVLRIISYGQDLCYRLENKTDGQEIYINPKKLNKVFDIKFNEIIINSLVQIYDLFNFIDFLLDYKMKYPEVKYTYHVHDFHCVCPSLNLVAKDWFCHLNCEGNNCRFDKFIYRYNDDIKKWRDKWQKLFFNTDRIVCFSTNSKEIIEKVYSSVEKQKLIVKPHDMTYCKFTPLNIKKTDVKNIAIVGACYIVPKGKVVIEQLLSQLQDNIQVHMIGSSSKYFSVKRKNVVWYGNYKHDDLPRILEKSAVDLVVFPSVWPETFSYVISELIQMNLPIVCFDLGAQGDKVREYNKGIVVRDVDEMVVTIEEYQ